jgi:hypothetical protein
MIFAATMMALLGVFQAIVGLVAIIDDEYFIVTRNYTFDIDTTALGSIHLLLGILVAAAGFFLFAGRRWAAIFAIVLTSLSAIANFFFIPYDPFWSILVIAIDVWVIWSLTRPGVADARG